MNLALKELIAYSDDERARWNDWFRVQPSEVFQAPVQPDGRFPTVWSLLDHIFVVEQRHLQRINSELPLPETTGMREGDWAALMAYGRKTRRSTLALAQSIGEQADVPREFHLANQRAVLTPKDLIFHAQIHEVRHWAQVAVALGNAGYKGPGDHDYVFHRARIAAGPSASTR
ncbi:MAG: DinB family protein [Candidatus Solibacter usitatus]|nr:DinB family protein [Candidatus Solibacter usitatus]